MPQIAEYNREAAVEYAMRWALSRNPAYTNYTGLGGDCTNFASQCLFAGSNVMNYTPNVGWFYINQSRRAPSWTGVPFLHNFLVSNHRKGVFATIVDISDIMLGDIIQLCNEYGKWYHSLVVCETGKAPTVDTVQICAHEYDAYMRNLNTYEYAGFRCLHINGVYM